MNDDQLLRYSRHILLNDIGIEGQARLLASRVVVIGAGGLGSPALLYLGTAGVGHITVIDNDVVDLTNLQRQIAHNMARAGMNKARSAMQSIAEINPQVQVDCITERADHAMLDRLVALADVVLDCCDNFVTRHAVNRACVKHKKPLVSGAAIQWDGQISVFDPRSNTSPCYACLFPPSSELEEVRCAVMGVFAPLVGIIGSMQAAEALKLLIGTGSSLAGRLLMLDGRAMSWTEVRFPRVATCGVCGH
ncbi:MAG: molybdopterin-synthase adenylyltransferase MoeB [Brachymonas sp.]|nr:molybdopterin-synthase adenylyltransferase MoeB [Brachymonas sp.]